MKLFTAVFTMIIITVLFGTILNKIGTIEQLENQLEHNQFQVDSLQNELYELIDTVQYELIDTTVIYWPWGREEFYYFKYKNS